MIYRPLYVIKSDKGFLADIERYTDDVLEAVTFVDFDFAVKKLASVRSLLKEICWVGTEYVPFPRPTPVQ